ncbi:MAG: DUF1566 domain-containing protein [Alistipes sp.]|nr:DUF1566 domain-containing protein [Alistipes sp.]
MLFVCFATTMASAQFYNKKKVVITEVVDKAGDVADGTKVFIRSALTDAITNSEGYTGFCDVSIVSIEYNFARTGTLSRESLSVIYQRYAAEFVLVSEINALDSQSVLLTARIINTHTGEIINSAMQRVMADLDYLPAACNQLVIKLLREKSATADTAAPAPKRAAAAFFANAPASSPAPAPAPAVRTYKVGDYIEINGVGGVVFVVWNNGQNGKAVSLKEFRCDWYSAVQKCSSLGKGWRLPSKSELQAVSNQKSAINNTLASMAENGLDDKCHWSSDEHTSTSAWVVSIVDGVTIHPNKGYDAPVRAVSAF